MKLTNEQLKTNTKRIEELLKSTNRKGVDALLKCMEEGGFFTASCHNHHCYKGGLAAHSLSTYKLAMGKAGTLSRDSIIICTLLHDLCNISGFLGIIGHGRRSLLIAMECGLELSDGEKCAIRWHMRHRDEISNNWDNVLENPDNMALYRLVYKADKTSAKYSDRLQTMAPVRGGRVTGRYEGWDGPETESKVIKNFSISKHLITWGFWRFVMGNNANPQIGEFEDRVDKRDRAPLVGDISPALRTEFFRRLKEMTGKDYAFPTFLQWEAARQQRVLHDTYKPFYEFIPKDDYFILTRAASDGKSPAAISQFLGLAWYQIAYRLVIND